MKIYIFIAVMLIELGTLSILAAVFSIKTDKNEDDLKLNLSVLFIGIITTGLGFSLL